MFGYIRPAQPELKVKHFRFYRAAYCGLCRALGRYTGQLSRMTLSYDFVFLALLRTSLSGEKLKLETHRCFVHPTSARPMLSDCPSLRYCVYANALLSYHNVRDKIADSRGFSHLAAYLPLPEVSHMRSAAIKCEGMGELDLFISAKLGELAALEAERIKSPDRAAQLFGELLARVFSFGLEGADERIADQIGLHIGRWIYLADAADDYGDDRRTGSYNPLVEDEKTSEHGDDIAGAAQTADKIGKNASERNSSKALEDSADGKGCRCRHNRKPKTLPEHTGELFTSLCLEMSAAAAALELIDFPDEGVAAILRNIIYQGLSDPLYAAGGIFKNALKEKDGFDIPVPKDI